jgi:hypothetical protein
MTDWIKHDGGPQPVANDVWVEAKQNDKERPTYICSGRLGHWPRITGYRILNQHLIDAARLEGIRLGLEAAGKAVEARAGEFNTPHGWCAEFLVHHTFQGEAKRIRALDPATIAREAVLDKLASEAQEQGMGYEKEADQ